MFCVCVRAPAFVCTCVHVLYHNIVHIIRVLLFEYCVHACVYVRASARVCVCSQLMPTVLFVSSVMSVLYYVGVMQMIIKVIAMVMGVTMGTTAPETVSTAASIFLGQVNSSS